MFKETTQLSQKVDYVSSLRIALWCIAEGENTSPVGLEKDIALSLVALSKQLRPLCPCDLLKA